MIVFEGLDRSGKSTQAKRLLDHINALPGRKAVLLPFPDRKEPFGQVIDRYLRKEIDLCEKALHLAFSANRWEKAEFIQEQIANGIDVICDRYAFSGVAYSIAKGMDVNWVKQADVGLPQPDAVFFFKVSPEVARLRGGFGQERLENESLQQKVATAMETLKKEYWREVNADGDLESVEKNVQSLYEQMDRSQAPQTIKKL